MKYFTPELLERFQSDDDEVADAAQEEWDRRCADYRKRLEWVKLSLPRQFQTLLQEYRLHDAQVVSGKVDDAFASTFGTPRLYFIELRPEASPQANLLLTYVLVGGQQPPDIPRGSYWMYDEIDISQSGFFSHTILFSDGRELALLFTDFQLGPVPQAAQGSAATNRRG